MLVDAISGIDTQSNVILLCDDRSSNGCIVSINGITYVISTGHGVLLREDENSPIRLRGSLEIKRYDGTPITWTKLLYESREPSDKGYYDRILIEVLLPAELKPLQLSLTPSLNMKLTNVASIAGSKTLVSGRVVTMTDHEAYIPAFTPSGASGLGLLDANGAVAGVIRATSDQHEGIDIPEGNYSVKAVGMMFMRALDDARHEPIYTVLILSQEFSSILTSPSRKEILPSDEFPGDSDNRKRARGQSSPDNDTPRAKGRQARWVSGISGAMRNTQPIE